MVNGIVVVKVYQSNEEKQGQNTHQNCTVKMSRNSMGSKSVPSSLQARTYRQSSCGKMVDAAGRTS